MSESNYERLKVVGEGSFGKVYKAKRKSNKQICAMKYIPKNRKRKVLEDAKKEIYLLERLRHPHIMQLIESFETDHFIILVCEYAKKELFRAMREERKQKFGEEKTHTIACQICSALYYLHSQRVLHRDLKPQNILVTKEGTMKICDFGFARFMGDEYYARTLQGTLGYMAPELFQHSHVHYTEKVDIWALGCILYELCVGRPAFDSRSLKLMHEMHKTFEPPNNLSPDLRHLLRKLLFFDHHHRIPWPYILKHPWFRGGIKVEAEDLARESPYTKPEIASQKRKEYYEKVKLIKRYHRVPRRRESHGKSDRRRDAVKEGKTNDESPRVEAKEPKPKETQSEKTEKSPDERDRPPRALSQYDNVEDSEEGYDTVDAALGDDNIDTVIISVYIDSDDEPLDEPDNFYDSDSSDDEVVHEYHDDYVIYTSGAGAGPGT